MRAKHTIVLVIALIVGSHAWRANHEYLTKNMNKLAVTAKHSFTKNISLLLVK